MTTPKSNVPKSEKPAATAGSHVTLPSPAASPEAVAIWNDVVGPKYAHHEGVMVHAAARHSDQIWSRIAPKAHEHVVDVGCGFGDTSLKLAQGARQVTAIDCAAPILERAVTRHGHVENLDFVLADVGTYVPTSNVHACFSRFGLMFFERPVQALRHLHTWLEPGARFDALVWRSREENPWLELARRVVLEVLPPVDDGAPSCGPGPFSMADRDVVMAQLQAAGFEAIEFEPIDVCIGETPTQSAEFQLALGPAGEIVRHAREQGHPGLELAREALERALSSYVGPNGVTLPSASWWVTARTGSL